MHAAIELMPWNEGRVGRGGVRETGKDTGTRGLLVRRGARERVVHEKAQSHHGSTFTKAVRLELGVHTAARPE
jgi:hypothetical protein